MLKPGIQWVLFDAVGTLLYPDPPVAAAYGAVAREFGSRLSPAEIAVRFPAAFQRELGTSLATSEALERARWQQIVAAVIDDVPANHGPVFDRLWSHFAAPQNWRLFPDVGATLGKLRDRGLRLGIASNLDSRLHAIVAGQPELALVETVFVSSQVGFAKPDPRFFAEIERRLGQPPPALALVGDDELNDFQGAASAGWQSIWLRRDPHEAGSPAIRSLSELLS